MAEANDGTRRAGASPAGGSTRETRDAGEVQSLAACGRVDRLVANGMSRLTAERMVAIERDGAEPGRARTHSLSRH